jgi:hypothetical protein
MIFRGTKAPDDLYRIVYEVGIVRMDIHTVVGVAAESFDTSDAYPTIVRPLLKLRVD